MTRCLHFDGLNTFTPIRYDAKDAGRDAPDGTRPVSPVRPAGSVRPEARSDALMCDRALVLKYAGGVESHSCAVLVRRPYEYGAVRIETRRRADAARRSETAHPFPLVEPNAFRWVYVPSEGTFRSEGMRIPPLRSAVQMESDVSPGSSVTLGRSERH